MLHHTEGKLQNWVKIIININVKTLSSAALMFTYKNKLSPLPDLYITIVTM